MVASIATAGVIVLLPRGVEISDASLNFVVRKKALCHTFNKYNKNYYYYMRWNSQRMLPVRFGAQFILSKDTPINYLAVLMTNLTNSILLINP